MEIEVKNSHNRSEILVKGNIKSLLDNDNLKNTIVKTWQNEPDRPIEIIIEDSFIITSSVIGFLIKFIKKDKMPLSIFVSNSELYEMLDDMNLIEVLNIRKAGL